MKTEDIITDHMVWTQSAVPEMNVVVSVCVYNIIL